MPRTAERIESPLPFASSPARSSARTAGGCDRYALASPRCPPGEPSRSRANAGERERAARWREARIAGRCAAQALDRGSGILSPRAPRESAARRDPFAPRPTRGCISHAKIERVVDRERRGSDGSNARPPLARRRMRVRGNRNGALVYSNPRVRSPRSCGMYPARSIDLR